MEASTINRSRFRTVDIAYIAMFAALTAVCSWISIPTTVPFTLQTFAVFASMLILGGERGFFAVLTYILLGAAGVPVFAEFSGGLSVLFGMTGGYIIGFLFTALIYWVCEKFIGQHAAVKIGALILGLAVCYAFGTVWFINIYSKKVEQIGLKGALGMCVTPFLIPDAVKLALAWVISVGLKKRIKI